MINIAVDVNRAVEVFKTIPMLGFLSDIVEVVIALPDPNKISVIINKTLFLYKLFSFFF